VNAETPPPIDLRRLIHRARYFGTEALRGVLEEAQDLLWEDLRRRRTEDGRLRYCRNGHYPRTLITGLGRVDLWVQRVFDRVSGRTHAPLLRALGIGKRRYTPDLRLSCAEIATRTSYGESSEVVAEALKIPVPRRTIWDFLQEIAPWVENARRTSPRSPPEERSTFLADSTFVKSQRKGPSGQEAIHVAVVQGQDHRVGLVEVRVGGAPAEALEGQYVERLTTDDDPGLMASPAGAHQLCHVHFVRRVVELLQEEGVSLLDREVVVAPLQGLLAHLRASTDLHRMDRNWDALDHRVRETLTDLGSVAEFLQHGGCRRTARFVRKEMRALVVFSRLAREGIWMPATSNGVERVMGMIADRCKRKWARWGRGLRNLNVMMLTRKTRPGAYRRGCQRYLSGWVAG
jgi:hypothetical protein